MASEAVEARPERWSLIDIPPGFSGRGGQLYQGGYPGDPDDYQSFDLVVNVAAGDPGPVGPSRDFPGLYLSLAMSDNTIEEEDERCMRLAARAAADGLRTGCRVLVHCAQGWNRSGVISARALMYLGMSADQAVEQVRLARGPGALANDSYARWLLGETEDSSAPNPLH